MKDRSILFIPKGSSKEKISGISHLFEHLLISEICHIYPSSCAKGLTYEDYIIIFFEGIRFHDIISIIKKMNLNRDGEFEEEKNEVLKEIYKKKRVEEEKFFRQVWESTIYEKSPVGDENEIFSISIDDILNLKDEVLAGPLFFFNSYEGLNIYNRSLHDVPQSETKITQNFNRIIKFWDITYIIFFFMGDVTPLFWVERILRYLNPEKHIQLCEKRKIIALIFEKGIKFPEKHMMVQVKKRVQGEIEDEIIQIKKNFAERAINELESVFFYNVSWADRLRKFYLCENSLLNSIFENIRNGVSIIPNLNQ